MIPFLLLLFSLQSILFAGEAADPSLLSLERIHTAQEFSTKDFGPTRWMEEGGAYSTVEEVSGEGEGKSLVRYDCKTGKRTVLVPSSRLTPEGQSSPLALDDYAWSEDRTKLLVYTNSKKVWRQNTRGDYWVLNLTDWNLQKMGGDADPSMMMFAKLSPDGERIAYVYKRDIYMQKVDGGKIKRLTTNGSSTIVNGTSDWVYEEEFDVRDGFRWSPDGERIAFWQFDTEGVRDFNLINNTDGLYSKVIPLQYPKVGERNSATRIGVIPADGGRTAWFELSDDPRNHYIPRMDWAANSDELMIQHMNRLQNTNRVMIAKICPTFWGGVKTGEVREAFVDRDDAWIDVGDDLKWMDSGKSFTWLSERDGWRHLFLISRTGDKERLLTPGEFDVVSVEKIDEAGGWVYYIASPDNPTQRYLYRVPLDGSGRAERLTPADQPGTHSYSISADSAWAIHTRSSFGNPPVIDLVSLPDHKSVRMLENNSETRERLAKVNRGKEEFFRIDIGEGVLLDAWRILPPDFDPGKKYPLFFYVYGEPAGQTVLDKWGGDNYMWHQMLAQRGYIVVSVDNRGTPAPRGREWRKCIYRQIGILASADQAAAARALTRKWDYVDAKRIGIWGWSGGGSMSLNAIFRYSEIYSTAMGIAFISNQRFYDTIYQERFMGLPDDNKEGFEQGSPITFAKNLKGNLLIVHGTGDDNCHYQSCEALVNELIRHNKTFTMMAYPNRSHSIKEGENTRRHLFELLTRYLGENLPVGE